MAGVGDRLVEAYIAWLRRELHVKEIGQSAHTELTTPFLDRHNDHLQVYVARHADKFSLTDDGYILSDLQASGFDLRPPKRRAALDGVLAGLGVRLEGEELKVEATEHTLGQRLHSLVQAMLAVNDLYVLSRSRVASFFWEDVKTFLDQHEVRYTPRVKVTGLSGYDHAIDFVIPKSKTMPERLLQAINAPTRNTIGGFLFALTDTREARGADAQAFVVLNDQRPVGAEVIDALKNYAVRPILWSEKERAVGELAA